MTTKTQTIQKLSAVEQRLSSCLASASRLLGPMPRKGVPASSSTHTGPLLTLPQHLLSSSASASASASASSSSSIPSIAPSSSSASLPPPPSLHTVLQYAYLLSSTTSAPNSSFKHDVGRELVGFHPPTPVAAELRSGALHLLENRLRRRAVGGAEAGRRKGGPQQGGEGGEEGGREEGAAADTAAEARASKKARVDEAVGKVLPPADVPVPAGWRPGDKVELSAAELVAIRAEVKRLKKEKKEAKKKDKMEPIGKAQGVVKVEQQQQQATPVKKRGGMNLDSDSD